MTRSYPGTSELPFEIVQVQLGRKTARGTRPLVNYASVKPKPKLFGTLAKFVRGILYFPDASISWLIPALKTALKVSKRTKFDAILTTHGPATEHIIGFLVARRRRLPWVADYRDLWTGNPFAAWGAIHRGLAKKMETYMISKAEAITAVTGITHDLEVLHKRDIIEIPNGMDQSAWEAIPYPNPSCFQFCYAGSLYGGRRSPELLFSAISKLRQSGDPAGLAARFIFLGPDTHIVSELASRYNLGSTVIVKATIDHPSALQTQRQSAILLLLMDSGRSAADVLGSKILEYAGAGRPILALGPPNSAVGKFLQESGLGRIVNTESECAETVRDAYKDFTQGLFSPPRSSGWKPWTGVDVAQRFAETLVSARGNVLGAQDS